eukprot:TRINITY_DN614_c0_g1_i5.p2 TRINITY_DN614_c0_g1~~TRINITY_DN614_c0_g1_i5.p2  ORF type:complete len:120 (+),score=39.73 TRINITY_DN614_c0_g1_i5:307-666(+)
MDLDVGPTKRCRHVVRMVNHILKANAEAVGGMQIERLIATWTPTWDPYDNASKLKKVLKHSQRGEEAFNALIDAEEGHPINVVGVDDEQFDPSYWNDHLDFQGDEFQVVECGDFSDDSA